MDSAPRYTSCVCMCSPPPLPPLPLHLCHSVCAVCVHIQNLSDNLPASCSCQENFTLMWDNPWLIHSHIITMSSRRLWKALGDSQNKGPAMRECREVARHCAVWNISGVSSEPTPCVVYLSCSCASERAVRVSVHLGTCAQAGS